MRNLFVLAALLAASPSFAHEQWANNLPVPAWVRSSCCGPKDVHQLRNDQVHALPGGWRIEGYPWLIAYSQTLPSQDGFYWAFYEKVSENDYTPIHCFFAPTQSY